MSLTRNAQPSLKKPLVIQGGEGWFYTFRKLPNRPVEFKKAHKALGVRWMSAWQFRYR